MNVAALQLALIRCEEVSGKAFNSDKQTGDFQASFNLEFLTTKQEILKLKPGETFDCRFTISTLEANKEPFFTLSMIGTFQVDNADGLNGLDTQEGAYSLSTLLFPYARNLAKPMLEMLGAADILFPFFPPKPTILVQQLTQPKPKQTRKTTPKA